MDVVARLLSGVSHIIQDILELLSPTRHATADDDDEVYSSSLLLLGPPGVGEFNSSVHLRGAFACLVLPVLPEIGPQNAISSLFPALVPAPVF